MGGSSLHLMHRLQKHNHINCTYLLNETHRSMIHPEASIFYSHNVLALLIALHRIECPEREKSNIDLNISNKNSQKQKITTTTTTTTNHIRSLRLLINSGVMWFYISLFVLLMYMRTRY